MKKRKNKVQPHETTMVKLEDHFSEVNMRAPGLFKPVKAMVLPNRGGMVALMHEYHADKWFVLSVDAKNVPAYSTIYDSKTFSESAWSELCDELTSSAKQRLITEAQATTATPDRRADAALELARLTIADDEKCEANTAKAREFVATHSPEQCEEFIRAEVARCKAMSGE